MDEEFKSCMAKGNEAMKRITYHHNERRRAVDDYAAFVAEYGKLVEQHEAMKRSQ